MDGLIQMQNDLIVANMPLITFITKKYYQPGQCDWDDMWSVAAMGLVKAAWKYNADLGFSFSTFAVTVMRNEIFLQLRKERKHLNCVSLDADILMPNGDKGSYYEILPDNSHLLEAVEDRVLFEKLWEDISQEEILLDYFGIGRPRLKQREIGEKYGFAQSYVSRLIKKDIQRVEIKVHTNNRNLD